MSTRSARSSGPASPTNAVLGVDFARTGPVLDAARIAVRNGVLDYVLITAEKS